MQPHNDLALSVFNDLRSLSCSTVELLLSSHKLILTVFAHDRRIDLDVFLCPSPAKKYLPRPAPFNADFETFVEQRDDFHLQCRT